MKKLLTGTLIGTIMFFAATAQTSKADPRGSGWYRDWETDRKSTRLNSSHRL